MKRWLIWLVISFAWGGFGDAEQASNEAGMPGRWFESTDFGFRVFFPEDWIFSAIRKQAPSSADSGDAIRARQIRMLVDAKQKKQAKENPPASMTFGVQWIRGMKGAHTANDILNSIRNQYREESSGSIQIYDTLKDPVPYAVHGVMHGRMDFVRDRGGPYFRTLIVCRVLGDYALIIQGNAWEPEAVSGLETVIQSLRYPDDPAFPVPET